MFQRIICISCSKLFLFRVLWDKGSALEFSSTLLLQQYPRSTYPHTSIILFMLYPLASKRNHPTLKTCPPFVPPKKKKLIRALIPPKYLSSVSEPPTELPYDSDRPPDELCIPPDIEPKSEPRRPSLYSPDRIERKLSRAISHQPFASVIAFKIDACLESLHGGHLPL